MRGNRRGFTIVELLVVVAIIVILAALVMPVIKRIKITTSMGLCASNLQDLYEVQEVYLATHGYKIPPMCGYCRYSSVNGGISMYTGSNGEGGRTIFFAGYYALHGYIDEGTQLCCPDTILRPGQAMSSISYLQSTSPKEWAENPSVSGGGYGLFGNYGLRWSGRKDKSYQFERLMFAEAFAAFAWGHGPGRSDVLAMHGDGYHGPNDPSAMSMNIVSSSGRVMGLNRFTDTRYWLWSDRNYYPYNERSGDTFVAPIDGDQDNMSDLGWGFWSSFDMELFDAPRFPWGDTLDEQPEWW